MIKPIAIYLPQFHPIPENDKAWGEGFTEWTNVRKAKPLFEGHYQPHVPHEDVGYYDLRDPEVMVRQAAMAKAYGIHGFAFYHYWFNGKRLLETPLDNMLKTGKPDFPFLYIWANENWTKRWDGQDNEVIINQEHSLEDDINHIRFLCKNVFSDKRYITIDGKPVFMVYRTELLPDIKETARIWREEAKKFGFKDLYLVRVEGFVGDIDPNSIGFDAAMEFAPNWHTINKSIESTKFNLFDYSTSVFNSLLNTTDYTLYRTIYSTWDNTARKGKNGLIFNQINPDTFRYAFKSIIDYTELNNENKFIFINSWNEWGEGCHLEPDEKYGYLFLEIIKNEIENHIENYLYINFLNYKIRYNILKNNLLYKFLKYIQYPFIKKSSTS